MNISYRILGYAEVFCEGDEALKLINLCLKNNLPYGDTKRDGEGTVFIFRLHNLGILSRLCRSEKIKIDVRKRGGIPHFFFLGRHRYGMLAGVICALLLLFFSQQFIWRIDVVGNESITTGEVLGFLEKYGLHTGTYIPNINADRIQNRMLIDSNDIAWVSVNVSGNTATVEIRERDAEGKPQGKESPANLISSKQGKITMVQIMNGNAVVRDGDIVQKGQLLVSGLFNSPTQGFTVTRAEGKVYAETTEEFYVKIPYEYDKKVYTGAEYCNKYLNFFDFSVKISKNYGNEGSLYDKISIMDSYSFLDGENLPISKTTEKYLEYQMIRSVRSKEEAEDLAYFELSQKIAEVTNDATLLRKVIVPEIHDDFFALRCVIVCIEDIAQTSEFEYSE